ncbi:melanocyte-stimulating hormone receptor-like [Oculina patagonica]
MESLIEADKHVNSTGTSFCTNAHGIHHYIFLSAFNISLSIVAFLGNVLILIALHKESSLHPPSKLMFRCLAITDLCVGLITQPAFAAELLFDVGEVPHLCYYFALLENITGIVFTGVSLMTLTAISVDRLLALTLGLRYRQVVTLRRVWAIVSCLWFACVASSFMQRFWIPMIFERVTSTVVALCLVTSASCYIKIFLSLRHHQVQILHQGQPNGTGGTPLNIARYKKTVSTALWVQITLIVFYLPHGLLIPLVSDFSASKISPVLGVRYTSSFVFLNSSLNPILYCWKIKEVRQAAKETVKRFYCL